MPLKSKLFQNDNALEACSVKDTAQIALGASGEHVSKIHTALLILDDVSVDANELSAMYFGPSTVVAVQNYKRRRRIVNFSNQLQSDNIVCKMTIAAMDREVAAAESLPIHLDLDGVTST